MMDIRRLVARRTDLSTFLVHLTRSSGGQQAADRLESILRAEVIEARTMFGAAKGALEGRGIQLASQKCVCFTETPLEYMHLLIEPIDGRAIQFERYGIAFTKKVGRQWGVNPVWYLDITPGHDWLTVPVNQLIEDALDIEGFDESTIARLCPFIEQMGTGDEYRKEFWWEREWRYQGNFHLPRQVLILCPENEIVRYRRVVQETRGGTPAFMDPSWGLEEIIGRLAGFLPDEIRIF